MHGGKSTGAPRGEAHGNYRTGQYTLEAVARRREFRALMKLARRTLEMVDGG